MRLLCIGLAASIALLAQIAGTYTGTWTGASGAGGSFEMKIAGSKCEVTFGFGEAKVLTKVTHCSAEGSKLEAKYEFDLGGNKLESTIKGEASGDQLTGKYTTKALPDGAQVDEGEWKAKK